MTLNWKNAKWRTSSRSGTGSNCVEVAWTEGAVGVRDSKNERGPVLEFNHANWVAFQAAVKDGVF